MGEYIIILIIFVILAFGLFKDESAFDTFLTGVKEGLDTLIKIIPPLVGLITAATVIRASGLLDAIIVFINPAALRVGIPTGAIPLILLRPITGSGSLAILTDILSTFGPDSPTSRFACVVMGSTETTLYTLTVYFGSAGIKKTSYAPFIALFADLTCFLIAALLFRVL